MAIPRRYPRAFLALLLALVLLAPTLALTPLVRAADCQVTNGNDSGNGSLRAALDKTGNFSGSDCATISFATGVTDITVGTFLTITRPVTIQGPGMDVLTIRHVGIPGFTSAVLFVSDGGALDLRGATVSGGDVNTGPLGAGINVNTTAGAPAVSLALDGVRVSGNKTTGAGGGLYATNATLTIANSRIEGNQAGQDGGGVYLANTIGPVTATLTNTTVTGNTTTKDGAGLYNTSGTVALTGSTVSGNIATGDFSNGGGLANFSGTLTLLRSTVATNSIYRDSSSSVAHGGGIFTENGTTTVTDSTVSGNILTAHVAEGAGIRQVGGTLTVSGSTISGNEARSGSGKGGGIFNNAGAVTVTNSTVSGNMAGAIGGGIRNLNDGGTIALRFVTVVGNSAPYGGGISGALGGLTYGQSIIAGNTSNSTPDDCYDTVTSQGYNVAGADCPATGPGDHALASGQALSTVVNPTLADNGGVATPHTLTHALAPGSPALAAAAGCLATDQRGVARPQSGMCDSGAYEATPSAPSPSPSANPSPSSNPSPNPSPSTGPCGTRFGDVPASDPACVAIEALAARGVINGCDSSATPPLFCPNDPTLRHQMAALIVRAIPDWAGETGLPNFTDNTDDTELMTRVGTLQRHNVVRGYQDEICTSQGKQPPCYGPLDTVKYGQVLLFISRAMVAKGYWVLQPDDRTIFPDQNGAAGAAPNTDQQTLDHRAVVTYVHYAGNPPDVADVHAPFLRSGVANGGWGDDSTRAWFARAFWPAIQGH